MRHQVVPVVPLARPDGHIGAGCRSRPLRLPLKTTADLWMVTLCSSAISSGSTSSAGIDYDRVKRWPSGSQMPSHEKPRKPQTKDCRLGSQNRPRVVSLFRLLPELFADTENLSLGSDSEQVATSHLPARHLVRFSVSSVKISNLALSLGCSIESRSPTRIQRLSIAQPPSSGIS